MKTRTKQQLGAAAVIVAGVEILLVIIATLFWLMIAKDQDAPLWAIIFWFNAIVAFAAALAFAGCQIGTLACNVYNKLGKVEIHESEAEIKYGELKPEEERE